MWGRRFAAVAPRADPASLRRETHSRGYGTVQVQRGCSHTYEGQTIVTTILDNVAEQPALALHPLHPRGGRHENAGAVRLFVGADHMHYRIDQCQVGERLREVAQVPAGARLDLLGVQVQRAGE